MNTTSPLLFLKSGETKQSLIKLIYGDSAIGKELAKKATFVKYGDGSCEKNCPDIDSENPPRPISTRAGKKQLRKKEKIEYSGIFDKTYLKIPYGIVSIAAKKQFLPTLALWAKMKKLHSSTQPMTR